LKVKCPHCDGRGLTDDPDDNGGLWYMGMPCTWCHGTGDREVLPQIPPPPEMDPKFLADLREWFINYGKQNKKFSEGSINVV
jgi:hypothetical protein